MNIFDALKDDHRTQRSLANTILRTEGKSKDRQSVYEKLRTELKAHARSEERFFYAILLHDDLTQQKSRHSLAEHNEIDEMISKLDETDMTSSAWMIYYKQLRELIFHHLEEEERQIFQLAGKVLSEKQKEELAGSYKKLVEEGRRELD
ncbi:MAG: hemerythrin domain-containing protein [Bacteroidota bacterium]